MGGMAAQIPIKEIAANEAAFRKSSEDKRREVTDGHDGTWVAHPGLSTCRLGEFDEHMDTPNQIHRKREDVQVTAADLLEVPNGTITEEGLRMNCSVGVQYIASWLTGKWSSTYQSPDGRCCNCGNFPYTSMAMDSPSRRKTGRWT